MISTEKLHFKILAPTLAGVPKKFERSDLDLRAHTNLIFDMQLVRGMALRECGQMQTQLTVDGRHHQTADADSWHILLMNGDDRIVGGARYRPIQCLDQFGAFQSALSHSHRYGPILRSQLERLVGGVKARDKHYGEVGGWALRPEFRGTTAGVNIAMMTFALAVHLESGLAITTATRNHQSASMLCRIGAQRIAGLPAFYEPKFGSVIELLQFNFPYANPRYVPKLERVRIEMLRVPVICAAEGADAGFESLREPGYARIEPLQDQAQWTAGTIH